MYSYLTPFLILNHFISSKFHFLQQLIVKSLWRIIWCSGMPITLNVFHTLAWSTIKGLVVVNKEKGISPSYILLLSPLFFMWQVSDPVAFCLLWILLVNLPFLFPCIRAFFLPNNLKNFTCKKNFFTLHFFCFRYL